MGGDLAAFLLAERGTPDPRLALIPMTYLEVTTFISGIQKTIFMQTEFALLQPAT